MGCLVEEDLDFRLKVNKVLRNKSFIAFLSHSDFIQKQNYVYILLLVILEIFD